MVFSDDLFQRTNNYSPLTTHHSLHTTRHSPRLT
jgi:hypothetical protein